MGWKKVESLAAPRFSADSPSHNPFNGKMRESPNGLGGAFHVGRVLAVCSLYDFCIMSEALLKPPDRAAPSHDEVLNFFSSRSAIVQAPPRPGFSRAQNLTLKHAESDTEALAMLRDYNPEVMICSFKISENFFHFLSEVKKMRPDITIYAVTEQSHVTLSEATSFNLVSESFNQTKISSSDLRLIDAIFIHHGNIYLFNAMISLLEDKKSIDIDTKSRIVLMVEDEPLFASIMLPLIYSTIPPGVHIVLVSDLETAENVFQRYQDRICGVLTDMRFPDNPLGKINETNGLKLLELINKKMPGIPRVLQTKEELTRALSEVLCQLGTQYLSKSDDFLLERLKNFMYSYMGFKEFIFRHPDGSEMGRAANLRDLKKFIRDAQDRCLESVAYHARNNHFSTWLYGRKLNTLAYDVRELKFGDDLEKGRTELLRVLDRYDDFVFRLPDGTEVGRAADPKELKKLIRSLPIESIAHHADNNEFSGWFEKMGLSRLAAQVRPYTFDHSSEQTLEEDKLALIALIEDYL
ncbi:MAG: hypothetical protein PHS02_01005 [Candidatus ainarchaeum sp.]|nr:hypothetical protein [Candidatus ainarchaeum sp.]